VAGAKASDIPVGTQFSPGLIDLSAFAEACVVHSGDKRALGSLVWQPPVRIAPVDKEPTDRRRSLPLEAAVQYGLLTPGEYEATDLAIELVKLPSDEGLRAFVRHVLLRRNGLRLVEMAERMDLEGLEITGDKLAAYCSDRGFNIVVHNTAINTMRMWLAKVGVFIGRGWKVDPEAKARILGLADTEIAALAALTPEQRAFAIALCRLDPVGDCSASDVRDLAESIYGRRLPRGNSRDLLQPLKDAGYLDFSSGGTSGGKTAILRTLPAFQAELLEPFLAETVDGLDDALVAHYKRPVDEIYAGLESGDDIIRGHALEAYAIHVMRLMGLQFVQWCDRVEDAEGGVAVCAVMTGLLGGVPSRWQIECRNTPRNGVGVSEVTTAVGLTSVTKATHVLILANAEIMDDAKAYAHAVMRDSALTIFLLGQDDFERIRASRGGALAPVIRSKSQVIASIERAGLSQPG